jgi:hypothetical protein
MNFDSIKMHDTNVKITSALFVLSGFGVSGVDFSDMTAIAIFGLTSCALTGDCVGTVTAFYGKTRLLRMRNIVIYGSGSGSAGHFPNKFCAWSHCLIVDIGSQMKCFVSRRLVEGS